MIPAQCTGIPAVLRTIRRNLSKIRIQTISHSESWNIQNPGMGTNIKHEAYSKPNKRP